MPESSPTRGGVLWAAADTGGVAALSVIAMLVMARFIPPAGFGIASLAMGVVLVANLYVEGLLHDTLIQREIVDDSHFRASVWAMVFMGLALFALTAVVAIAARGTRIADLSLYIAGSAATLPFSGLNGVINARLRRSFRYGAVAAPSVMAKVIAAISGVIMAWAHFGAWSLIAQFIISTALQSLFHAVRDRGIPPPTLNFKPVRPLLAFALPNAAMHTLVGLRLQVFAALVAGYMGFAAAGYINLAFRLTTTPQVMLQTALTNLGLPLLARQQADPAGFRDAYLTLNRLIAATMTPCFVGLAVCAPYLVRVVLGETWLPSVGPMEVLALSALVYLLRLPASLALRAMGHVRFSFFNALFHIVFTGAVMAILRPTDMIVVSLLWAAPLVVTVPATWVIAHRYVQLPVWTQFQGTWPAFIASGAMAAAVLGVQKLLIDQAPIIILAGSILAGAACYGAIVLALDGELRRLTAPFFRRRLPLAPDAL